MNEQPDAGRVLDGIGEALEARGYSHMTNGKSIGNLLDELEALRAQSDAAEAIAAEIREKPEFKEMVAQARALAQSNAEPVAWTRERISEVLHTEARKRRVSHLGLPETADILAEAGYTAPPRPDTSGLIEAAEWLMERAHLIGGMSARSYREAASALRFRAANARGLQTKIRAADRMIEAAEWPFGYQDTFNLISDATGLVGGQIGISVSKFEKAYNKLRSRAADRSGREMTDDEIIL